MPDNIPELPNDNHVPEPEKKDSGCLQTAKVFYSDINLPSGWDDTIDPEEYFQNNEEARHHIESYKDKWKKKENLIGHLVCLFVILIVFGIHFSGIHKWSLFNGNEPTPISTPLPPEECHPFKLSETPDYFKGDIKKINQAIKEKKWGQAEKLLENILSSKDLLSESEFRKNCFFCAIKTFVITKKYQNAWKRFVELRQQLSDPKELIPYSVMYAAVQAKYEIATKGSYGNGMPLVNAVSLVNTLKQIRTNYAEDADNDSRILLFETDALLSSLGKDNEMFDIQDQRNIATWEQFEFTLAKLIKQEKNSRTVLRLQYRKYLKIKSFCRIPFYDEKIVIGKYAYDEKDIEKMQKYLLNQLRG